MKSRKWAHFKLTLFSGFMRIQTYFMKTIGRIDFVDFPDLQLNDLNIKVDTGAYTSSIHCHDIRKVLINNEEHIVFKLLDPSHPQYNNKEFTVKKYKEKDIKSSFGNVEQRQIIKTSIIIFAEEHPIELSLSERGKMKYPVLLGRRFLKHRFVVDTSKKNLSFQLKDSHPSD